MPFLPLYFHQLGVTDVGRVAMWSGLSLGVTPALTALLSPLWGRLADRFGRKIMVERSLVSFVVVMAAMAFVTRPWHVFALRAVQGLFAGYGALTLTMAADSAPPGQMAQAIGTVQTAQRLGPALGPVFGGIDRGDRRAAPRVPRRRRASISIALVVVFLDVRRAQRARRMPRPPAPARATVTFRNVLAFENFLLMAVVIFGLQFVDRSFGPVLPLYVGELGIARGAHPARLGRAVLDRRRRRRDRPPLLRARCCTAGPRAQLIAASAAVAAAGTLGYLVAHDVLWLFLATPFFGLAIGVGDDGGLHRRGGRDSGQRARHRLRPPDHRVARRARRQPDCLRPAGRDLDPRGVRAGCGVAGRAGGRGASAGWRRREGSSTPSEEPVPENL